MSTQLRKQRAVRLTNHRGQQFLEYLVILGVIIAAIVAFARGGFNTAVNGSLTSGQNVMQSAATAAGQVDLNKAAGSW